MVLLYHFWQYRAYFSVRYCPKYLIEYRLEKSRELLEQTILKVSDIATHVGYNDVSHYIQSFRKVYGMTPEEYRSSLGRTEA